MKKKAIMVLALAAAMTMSACGANSGGTAGEATSANESAAVDNAGDNAEDNAGENAGDNAGEKTTAEKETEKETEETTTEETTAAEIENELFAYYKPLGEAYEKYKYKKISNFYIFNGRNNGYYDANVNAFSPIAEYNNVLYFHNRMFDDNDSNNIYSYNIDTKEYKKLLDLNSIGFPDAPSKGGYVINFLDGYFYVNFYAGESYYYNHKIDPEGNIVQSFLLDYNYNTDVGNVATWPYLNPDGSIIYSTDGIIYEADNSTRHIDSENADANGYIYFRVSPDFKTTTEIKAPEIEAEHGIMEKAGIYSLSADSDGNLYCVTKDYDVFCMKKGTDEWVNLGDFGLQLQEIFYGKYWRDGGTIFDIENGGEVVAESDLWSYSNARNYFCGDGNIVLHDGAWYKVQVPSDGSNIDFSQYEPMGKESRSENNIVPVNDTYYLYHDDYGYFLHTYEKGEEEEETVTLFEK